MECRFNNVTDANATEGTIIFGGGPVGEAILEILYPRVTFLKIDQTSFKSRGSPSVPPQMADMFHIDLLPFIEEY